MCLSFEDDLTNWKYLDVYRTCVKSGCVMDTNRETLMKHIQGAATDNLPFYLRHQFWTMGLLGQVRADNWKEVADNLVRDSASNNLLNRIIPASQTRFNTTSSSSGGMPLFPFSIAINSSATSAHRAPFSSSGTFSQFGSSPENLPGSNLDRRQGNGNRNGLGSRKVGLGSITSFCKQSIFRFR